MRINWCTHKHIICERIPFCWEICKQNHTYHNLTKWLNAGIRLWLDWILEWALHFNMLNIEYIRISLNGNKSWKQMKMTARVCGASVPFVFVING